MTAHTNHTIRLTTRDSQSLTFGCPSTENVVAAAAVAGIFLPVQCRAGACGCCRATCRDGEYELRSHSPDALSAEAAAQREVLLCQTYPKSPLSVALPFDSSQIATTPTTARATTITAVERVGGSTLRLELVAEPNDQGTGVDFEPGQYMELEIPNTGIRRPYSLANIPNWDGRLEFLIRLRSDGQFSNWLDHAARPGDPLLVRGPFGNFVLHPGARTRCFLAGGTGLAPVLSMVRRMAEWQEPNPTRLYFGVNTRSDLVLLSELNQLATDLPRLKVILCLFTPDAAWSGVVGSPADALERDLEQGTVTSPDIYVCGPPALIQASEAMVQRRALPASQFFSEKFVSVSVSYTNGL